MNSPEYKPVSAEQVALRTELSDWRLVLGRLETTFRTGSFASAAALTTTIAAAADAVEHHPDIDIRYRDKVHVAITTHATGGLTEHDCELAVTISALAATVGATVEPSGMQAVEIALDAVDIDAIRPFWNAVLGYVDNVPTGYTGQVNAIRDPARIGPPMWFQQMDEPRHERNRFHIDVTVTPEVAQQRIDAALAAGGAMVTAAYARSWWVLADPEGNEACICTWQDRN